MPCTTYMGLLRNSKALEYEKIQEIKDDLKRVGTQQFIDVYHLCKKEFHNTFVWGDEIEVIIVAKEDEMANRCGNEFCRVCVEYEKRENNGKRIERFDTSKCKKGYKLLLGAEHFTSTLRSPNSLFTPEFASYMIESTPKLPYTSKVASLLDMEGNMIERLECIKKEFKRLNLNGFPLLMTVFPNIGYNKAFYGQIKEKKEEEKKEVIINNTENKIYSINDKEDEKKEIGVNEETKSAITIESLEVSKDEKKEIDVNEETKSAITIESLEVSKDEEKEVILSKKRESEICILKENKNKNICEIFEIKKKFLLRGKHLEYETTLSYFFPDNAITNHYRFFSFVRNIRKRRGKKIEGYIAIMRDINSNLTTTLPYKLGGVNDNNKLEGVNTVDSKLGGVTTSTDNQQGVNTIPSNQKGVNNTTGNTTVNGILIDSMGQGMGCCCLQVTLQASELNEARLIYDQLAVICPLLLRITRATPLAQGRLLNTETRWDMLVYSVDCRTDIERGNKYEKSGFNGCECNLCNISYNSTPQSSSHPNLTTSTPLTPRIPKSRFSSIDMFISQSDMNLKEYNDIYTPINKECYTTLIKEGVDDLMARHVSSLFVRDPILVYEDSLQRIEEMKRRNESGKGSNVIKGSDESKCSDVSDNVSKGCDNNSNDNNNNDNTNNNNNSNTNKNSNDNKKSNTDNNSNHTHINNTDNNTPLNHYTHINKLCVDEFENIQSSNWRSMRFKLPDMTYKETSGWKVEIRPMELQPTCFENSAFCVFVVLLSRAIISYNVNFYVPISIVDENFRRANLFLRNVNEYKLKKSDKEGVSNNSRVVGGVNNKSNTLEGVSNKSDKEGVSNNSNTLEGVSNKSGVVGGVGNKSNTLEVVNNKSNIQQGFNNKSGVIEGVNTLHTSQGVNTNTINNTTNSINSLKLENDKMKFYYRKNTSEKGTCILQEGTIEDIFCGTDDYNGIISIVSKFIREHCNDNTVLHTYIDYIRQRANGTLMSVSDWIRAYVVNHCKYKEDSVVNEEIVDDLIEEMKRITERNDYSYLRVKK